MLASLVFILRLAGCAYHGWAHGTALLTLAVLAFCAEMGFAPPASADPAADLTQAVTSVRSESSCAPLHHDSVVERAAAIVNRSTDEYLDQTARQVPLVDPLPALKDLGYGGNKATIISGAAKDVGDAIKGLVVEGFAAIPDCGYHDFGASLKQNPTTGYHLAVLVLAGP